MGVALRRGAIVTSDGTAGDGAKLKAQGSNLVVGLRWMRQREIPPAHWQGDLWDTALGWRCRLSREHVGHQARETR